MKRYILHKFPLGDLYFLAPKGKNQTDKWQEVICGNCLKPISDNPIETLGYENHIAKYNATFVRHIIYGKEKKILCCPNKKKCQSNENR